MDKSSQEEIIATSEGIIYNIWIVLAGAAAAAASYNIANNGDPVASPNFFLSIGAFVLACVTMRPRTSLNTGVTTMGCVALILGAFTLGFTDDNLPLAIPAFVVTWLSLLCFSSTHWRVPWKLVPRHDLGELLSFSGDYLQVALLTLAALVAFVLLVVGCVVLYTGDHSVLPLEPALLAAVFGISWVWSDTVLFLPLLASASFFLPSALPVKISPSRAICLNLADSKFDSCILAWSFIFVGILFLIGTALAFVAWSNPGVKGLAGLKEKFTGTMAKIVAIVLVVLFALGAVMAAIDFIVSFFADVNGTLPGPAFIDMGDFWRWLILAFAIPHVAAVLSVAIPECYIISVMSMLGIFAVAELVVDADKTNAPFIISCVLAFASNSIAVVFYVFGRLQQVGMAGMTGESLPSKVGFWVSFGVRVLLGVTMVIGAVLELSEVPELMYTYKAASFLAIAFIACLGVVEPTTGMIAALLQIPGRAVALAQLPADTPKNMYVGDTMVVVGLGGLAFMAILSISSLINWSVFTAPWRGDDEGAANDTDPHANKALLHGGGTSAEEGAASYGANASS